MTRLATLLSILLLAAQVPASSLAPPKPTPEPLYPEAPTALVTLRSLDDVHALWAEITARTGNDEDGAAELHAALARNIPRFSELTDPSLPLAMALRMPPLMMQQEPVFSFFLPLMPNVTDAGSYVDMDDVAVALMSDGYLALSSDPTYAPAAATPALAVGMLDGLISASVDMEGLITTNRAMIEMGLASAPMAIAMADSTGEAEMSLEQIKAMTDLIRLLITSLRRCDLSLDKVGDDLVLHTRTAMIPDSTLDQGPQPAFAEALALTRLLPPGALMVQASSTDFGRLKEALDGVSAPSALISMPQIEDEAKQAAFAAWWTEYEEIMAAKTDITASSLRMDDGKFSIAAAMKVPDADALLAQMVRLADDFQTLDLGFGFERLADGETRDVRVYGWKVDFETLLRQAAAAEHGGDVPDDEDFYHILALMSSVSSEIRLCARDGVLLFALDDDSDGIAGMVRAMDLQDARIDPNAAALAERAGPDCRKIFYGDFGTILDWSLGMVPAAADITIGPVEFSGFMSLEGPDSDFELAMGIDGVVSFVEFVRAMEEAEGDGASHGD